MNGTVPNKRSPQLKPLSREHHDGMLFVSRLRKGLNNHTGIYKLAKYVGWFWRHHIRPHFFQEETILLAYLAPAHALTKKLKEDHTEILELMLTIDQDVERFDIVSLANFIELHIRWEEEIFFEHFEKDLSTESLDAILEKLQNHPVRCEVEWNDEFWDK